MGDVWGTESKVGFSQGSLKKMFACGSLKVTPRNESLGYCSNSARRPYFLEVSSKAGSAVSTVNWFKASL